MAPQELEKSGNKGISLYKEFTGHIEPINSIGFSPNNELVCTTSSDKTCRIVNIETNLLIKQLTFGSQLLGQDIIFRGSE